MDMLQTLFLMILFIGAIAIFYILIAKPANGNATLAGLLSLVFGAYTAVQIGREGVIMFFTNHTGNLTGLQVWWDLVMCVTIALFFIIPRARSVGMNVWPWTIFAGLTASIGLLAMCARLFWLEKQASTTS